MNKLSYLRNKITSLWKKEAPKQSSGNLTPGERDRLFEQRRKK